MTKIMLSPISYPPPPPPHPRILSLLLMVQRGIARGENDVHRRPPDND